MAFSQAFRNIDDILRKEAGCTTELDYTEQTSWLLFLKYLDDLEQERAIKAQLQGRPYIYPRRPLPLGCLGSTQGQRWQDRSKQGYDRRRFA